MAKWVADAVLNQTLEYLASNANRMIACSAQPANGPEATGTYDLSTVSLTSGDYTVADVSGGAGGRKVTIGEKSGITIDHSGTAKFVALVASGSSTLLYVTTCNELYLTAAQTMTFGSWAISISDPT